MPNWKLTQHNPAKIAYNARVEELVCQITYEYPELSQREIVKLLQERYNITCNQSTVSRIQKRVTERSLKNADERMLSAKERVLRELGKIAYAKITDYLTFDASGVVLKASDEIPEELIAAVAEVSQTETKYGTNVSLKLHDKQAALNAICKIFGINAPEKQELSGKDGGPISTEVVIKIGDEPLDDDTSTDQSEQV